MSFLAARPLDAGAFEGLPVRSVEAAGHHVTLFTSEPEAVLAALFGRGVAVSDLEVVGATLEEALLSLTRRPAGAP